MNDQTKGRPNNEEGVTMVSKIVEGALTLNSRLANDVNSIEQQLALFGSILTQVNVESAALRVCKGRENVEGTSPFKFIIDTSDERHKIFEHGSDRRLLSLTRLEDLTMPAVVADLRIESERR